MTGYGKASTDTSFGKVTVEIQSINKKYCEIQINLPRVISYMEEKIRKKMVPAIARGRVTVGVTLDAVAKKNFLSLLPDLQYAEMYLNALQEIKQKFNLSGDVDINIFQGNRDILVAEHEEPEEDEVAEELFSLIDSCLVHFNKEKETEGRKLVEDIRTRLAIIEEERDGIQGRVKDPVEKFRERLLERIAQFMKELPVDEDRIARETALYADKIDVSEELVRLESHIINFTDKLNDGGVIGKNLDFIIQEMFRETNTIASKCNNVTISQSTIRIRSELEKIREQVQNIE